MPTNVIMPALELAQETGKVLRWMKAPGDPVRKGEPLVEIETDKVTVEIEAPASGILSNVTAREGDVIPVGQTIALIADSGPLTAPSPRRGEGETAKAGLPGLPSSEIKASPLARRLAEEHGVDLAQVKTVSGKIEKADVLAFVESRKAAVPSNGGAGRLVAASPKARRLAAERGVDLGALRGSGPGGAVLAVDVPLGPGPLAPGPSPPGPLPGGERERASGRCGGSWPSG
jgi:pyruvate dehydrogenase E2 component (dihydrolipoamide acetyltransferase)